MEKKFVTNLGLLSQREIDENNARVLKEAGYTAVKKDMPNGSFAAVREFDMGETCQDPNNQPTSGSLRLGDSRVMSKVDVMPPEQRTYQTAGDVAHAVDPFLHRDVGEENANTGPAGGARGPIQGYRYSEPDADRRDMQNWPGDRTESGIAPAAAAKFPEAGEVGSRVIKRAAGLFTSLIFGGRK